MRLEKDGSAYFIERMGFNEMDFPLLNFNNDEIVTKSPDQLDNSFKENEKDSLDDSEIKIGSCKNEDLGTKYFSEPQIQIAKVPNVKKFFEKSSQVILFFSYQLFLGKR